jgi:hypothetical protein
MRPSSRLTASTSATAFPIAGRGERRVAATRVAVCRRDGVQVTVYVAGAVSGSLTGE